MNHLYRNPNDHLVACDYADQAGGVGLPYDEDDEWEPLNDLFDVTILDEFGCQVTKPAYQWADQFDAPGYVGELYHYQGES